MSKLSDRIIKKLEEDKEQEAGYNVKKKTVVSSSNRRPSSSGMASLKKETSSRDILKRSIERAQNSKVSQPKTEEKSSLRMPYMRVEDRANYLFEQKNKRPGGLAEGKEFTQTESRGPSINLQKAISESPIISNVAEKIDTAIHGADSGQRIQDNRITYREDPKAQSAIEATKANQLRPDSDFNPTDLLASYDLTDDETNEYWYRYARDGRRAAGDYLESLNSQKFAEEAELMKQQTADLAEKNPAAAAAIAIGAPIASAPQQFIGAIGTGINTLMGKGDIDPNDPMFRGSQVADAATAALQDKAKAAAGVKEGSFWAGLIDFGVSAGLSIGQNMARLGTAVATGGGSGLSLLLAGLQSGTSTLGEAAEQDVSSKRALLTGLTAGIAEGFFEKYSLEGLINMGPADSVKHFFQNVGKQMLIEGSEEMATEISNSISDALIMGESSKYEQYRQQYLLSGASDEEATRQALIQIATNVGLAGLGGAISGAAMSGPAMAYNSYRINRFGSSSAFQTSKDFSELADSIDTSEISYIDQNGMVDQEALQKAQDVQQMASDMAQRSAAGETINNYQKGELAARVYDLVNAAERTQLRDAETVDVKLLPVDTSNEATFMEASKQWENILRRPDFQRADISDEGASYKIVRNGDTVTVSGGRTDDSGFEPVNISGDISHIGSGDESDIIQAIPLQMAGYPQMSVKVSYGLDQTSTYDETTVTADQSDIDTEPEVIDTTSMTESGANPSAFSDQGIAATEMKANTPGMDASGRVLDAESSGLSDSAKETMVSMYDGNTPMQSYMTAFRRYYAVGREDLPMSYAENTPYAAFLTTEQKQAAFREGALEHNRALERRQQVEAERQQNKGPAREGGLSYASKEATEAQKKVAEHIGKRTGLKIEIRKLKEIAEYDSEKGIIRIDPEAENFNASLAHELTHFIQDYDQKAYEAFKRLAIESLMTSSQTSFDELYERYEAPYMEQYGGVDYDIVTDEIAADAAGMFLNDEEFINRVVSEDRSLAEKIRDFFRDIADTLRSLINSNVRKASRALKENEARYRTAQGLWTKALETAGERSRSGEQSVTGARIKKQLDMGEAVEETRDLIAVHNLNATKLNQVLDLGGFVMPSIAVTRADIGHTNFGDISLVFRKDTIDPSDSRNKVYSADAYTTRMPTAEYEYDRAALRSLAARMDMSESQLEANYLDGNAAKVARNLEYAEPMQQLYAESRGEVLPEDRYERRDRLREITGYEAGEYSEDYKAFVQGELNQIVKGQGFLRDIDPFDSRGNRRSWRAMHTPYTPDSALNMMLSQRGRNQEGSLGITASNLKAAISDQYGNIEDIRANEDRIQMSDDMSDLIDELDDRLYELTRDIAGGSWAGMDTAADALLSSAKRPTARNINRHLSKYGLQVTEEQAAEFADIVSEIKKIPVKYFEAKPERVVGFDEIAVAVIPDDTSQKLKDRLNENRIPVIEYEAGNDDQRKSEMASIPNIRFQIRELDDGTSYVDVDVDQERFDGLSPKEQIKEAAKVIRERFANRVIGIGDNYARVTGRTAKEYRGKHYAPDIMEAKARLSPELDNLLSAAQYLGHESDDGHHPEAVGGWDYYRALFNVNGTMYTGDINVMNREDYRLLYDVYKINKAPETLQESSIALPWLYATGDRSADNAGALSEQNISQDSASVNPMQQSETDRRLRKQLKIDEESVVDPNRLLQANENLQTTTQLLSETLSNATYMPSDEQIQRTAKKLKTDTKSLISDQELFDKLKTLYNYVQHNDNINGEEMAGIASDIADSLLSNSRNEYDPEDVKLYREYLDHIKGCEFKIGDAMLEEVKYRYGSMKDLRSRYFGRLDIKRAADSNIDQIYQELSEMYPADFPSNVSNDADQLAVILDGLDALRPHVKNPADDMSAIDYRGYTYEIGKKIFDDYFTPQAKAEFNKAFKNYREATQRQYQRNLARTNKRNQELIQKLASEYAHLETEEQKKTNRQRQAALRDQRRRQQQAMTAYRRAADAESRHFYNDRYNIQRDRQIIMKDLAELNSWLLKPTDKKHVPESLRASVADFLSGIDFSSDRLNLKGDPTAMSKSFAQLKETYRRIKDGEASDLTQLMDVDPDMLHMIDELVESTKGISRLGYLDAYQTRTLKNVIRAMKKSITDVNKLLANKRYESVESAAESTMTELDGRKPQSDKIGIKERSGRFLQNDMLDSYTRFHTFGAAAESMYNELREGFNVKIRSTKEASDYMHALMDRTGTMTEDLQKWGGVKADMITYTTDGGDTIKIKPSQIMSLYALNKRAQAQKHLYAGGINTVPLEYTDGKVKKKLKWNKNIKLTKYDVNRLISMLTPQQKAMADGIGQFFMDYTSKWGNEASMAMYGYEKFLARDYFPIKVDRNQVATKDDQISGNVELIKNMGETKGTQEKATNPILLDDIFNVFTTQVDHMGSYRAFLVPLSDMQKWLNYRRISYEEAGLYTDLDKGGTERPFDPNAELTPVYKGSVKQSIENAYGKEAVEYVRKLLQDINGATTSDPYFLNRVISSFKGAAMGMNIRTAIQQPTAYLRAVNEIDAKYLLKGLTDMNPVGSSERADKVKKYSAIAQWKDWGFYETDIGRSMRSILMGNATKLENIRDKQMILNAKGDEIAWNALWRAAELETQDKYKDLEVGSEAFYETVAERFDEIVDRTQVVDSVFHRTQLMRSKDGLTKMATSFMSEPAKSYNMLYRAYFDRSIAGSESEKKKAVKKMMRAGIAYLLSSIGANAAASIVSAIRDDDEEKTWGEKYLDALNDGVKDSINPLQLIPGVRDVLSIVQGYDVARTDMSLVQDFWWAITDALQKLEGTEKKTWASVITNLVQRLAAFTGLGFENLLNDTISLINTMLDIPVLGDTAPAQLVEYQIASSQYDRGYKGNLNTFVRQALSAYAADNKELGDQIVKDLLSAGIEEDAIRNKLSSMLSDDERLETAAQLKIDGDAGYDSLVQEMEDDGYPRDLIENKIASKIDDLAPSYSDVIASLDAILESGDFKSKNYETFNDQISSLVKAKQAKNGWTAKDTRKNIRTQITKEFKPRYESGNAKERQQILNLLSRVRVLDENIYEDEDITSWAD